MFVKMTLFEAGVETKYLKNKVGKRFVKNREFVKVYLGIAFEK